VELPLFAGEYWLGNKLMSHSETPGSWVKPTHVSVAAALGGLFALNTVTGVWNLYDSRHDTDDRALVWSHSALMLAAVARMEAMGWREDCVDCAVAVLTQDGHENTSYHVTGPNRETFAEVAAMLSEVTARPVRLVETDDAGMYAHFDALGIPREPVDDQTVAGIPWNSDDMVSFERAIREGFLDVCTDDVERLTGRRARSVLELIEANADFLRTVT
jgi:uncharacterized protein YbjT (DUF2867 family)